MEAESKQFIFKLSLFSLIVTGIAIILFISILKPYYVQLFPLQLLVIGSFTAISHLQLLKAVEKNIQIFTSVFILSITLKLLVYFSFLVICLLIDRSNARAFVISFFALYVCFTTFEVIQLINVKKNK